MMYELKRNRNGYEANVYDVLQDKKRMIYKKIENTTLDKASDFLEHEGVDPEEVDVAIEQMVRRNHNKASFGILGGFIGTSKE